MTLAANWRERIVGQCLVPISFRNKAQVQARDYLPAGRFPVIDQGQNAIAGWTDDESAVIDAPLPVVVFGDHSRTLKFVDFPFVRGADGTQVLVPSSDLDPLFFYFACKFIDVPARGYNRHFGQLKESVFACPVDIEVQRLVAGALRSVDAAISLEAARLATVMEIKQSAMATLFTCGQRGEGRKDTEIGCVPTSWRRVNFAGLGQVVTGGTPSTKEPKYYLDGNVPFVSPGDIEHGMPTAKTEKRISALGLGVSRRLPAGTTLVVCIGSTIGKVGRTTAEWSASNQQINAIIPAADIASSFLTHLMTWSAGIVRTASSPSPVPILSKGPFEKLHTYIPTTVDEQTEIASILDAIDHRIALHQQKRAVLEELFKALLHKLMTGQIEVNDLDLTALQDHTQGSPA